MKLFVGNLSFEVIEGDLRKVFEPFGEVLSITIMREKHSNESRGFGFVEMPTRGEALAAIEALNGKECMGRTLNVNEARPRPQLHQDNRRRGSGGKGGGRRHDSRRRGGKGRSGKRRAGWNF